MRLVSSWPSQLWWQLYLGSLLPWDNRDEQDADQVRKWYYAITVDRDFDTPPS
jgi:hypothetical protein